MAADGKLKVEFEVKVNIPKLEMHTFTSDIRVPKRVWVVHHPDTGERIECRLLRRLLWVEFAPRWAVRIQWAVEDFSVWLRCGFYCDDCGKEWRWGRHHCG